MTKQFLFSMSFLLLVMSCEQKSEIVNYVQAEELRKNQDLTFTLDDTALAYQTPLPGVAPIIGGVIKLVGDIFARNTDMGFLEMSYTQPIPEIHSSIKSIKLKRFFFYMKPKKVRKRKLRDTFSILVQRYILGQGDPTFGFLGQLAVRMSADQLKDPKVFTSTLVEKLPGQERDSLLELFDELSPRRMIDTEYAQDVVLLRYDKNRRVRDTRSANYGTIHYLELDKKKMEEDLRKEYPGMSAKELETLAVEGLNKAQSDLKEFFMRHPKHSMHFEKVLLFENSLLVELKKGPVANEIFQQIMNEHADMIEEKYYVNFIDTCNELSCLELKVPDVNLVPIAKRGNALRIDSILDAVSVPDSFKLKGFVVFEVKIDAR